MIRIQERDRFWISAFSFLLLFALAWMIMSLFEHKRSVERERTAREHPVSLMIFWNEMEGKVPLTTMVRR